VLSQQVKKLETENRELKLLLQEMRKSNEGQKESKKCGYCKHYMQYYGRHNETYFKIYAGHCMAGVPVKHGGKRKPVPDDSCPYFEIGI